MDSKNDSFASLFKKLRLRSGFATLSDFGDSLTKEGLTYETSLFSHWQKGDRIPKDRKIIISMINVFIKKGAIHNASDANNFLKLASQRDLDEKEIGELFDKNNNLSSVPSLIPNFIGRERYLKDVCWLLLNGRSLIIQGEAGIGKTVLAIKTAILLKDQFSGGILWFRNDIMDLEEIMDSIGKNFGINISRIKDLDVKLQVISKLLSNHNSLVIFDNVESYNNLKVLLENTKRSVFLITSKHNDPNLKEFDHIKIKGFTYKEAESLSQAVLGRPFVLSYRKLLGELIKRLSYSPLALNLFLKRIEAVPNKITDILVNLDGQKALIYNYEYDNKNLFESINLSYEKLTAIEKDVFSSLSVFKSEDIPVEAVSYINNITITQTKTILTALNKYSLIEKSRNSNYRIHPFIKDYASKKLLNGRAHKKLAYYYLKIFELKQTYKIEKEVMNIEGIINSCFKEKYFKEVILLWNYFGRYLWNHGYWKKISYFGDKAVDSSLKVANKIAYSNFCLNDLSWLYFWQGDIGKSYKYASRGKKAAEKNKDTYLVAVANIRLGKIYQIKGIIKKSDQYLKNALDHFIKISDLEKCGDILTYLGENQILRQNYKTGGEYLKRAMRIVDKIKDLPQKAIILTRLGAIALKQRDFAGARQNFKESLTVENKVKRRAGGLVWNNIGLGLVSMSEHHLDKAKSFFKTARREMLYLGIDRKASRSSALIRAFEKELIKNGFYRLPSHSL